MGDCCLKSIEVGTGAVGRRIAVSSRPGTSPGILWLGGFNSDMNGIKARALDEFASDRGRAIVRFDYSGHGVSGGAFTDGTIGRWLEESLAVFGAFCHGPQVLVGSSMGGWLALLLVRDLLRRNVALDATVGGLVLVAPAVDFTEALMWNRMPPEIRSEIEQKGVWERPSAYSPEPYLITRGLIEEGRNHLLLGGMIETDCPVRI